MARSARGLLDPRRLHDPHAWRDHCGEGGGVRVKVAVHATDRCGMYAGCMTATTGGARWARGLAVALVTVPGVLLAQLLTVGSAPGPREAVVVCAVVAAVACAVPTRITARTAVVAALAQL